HFFADEARRARAGDQHRADEEVGRAHRLIDGVRVGVERMDAALVDIVEVGQDRGVDVEDDDVGAEADRHARRVLSDDAAADDRDAAAPHAGHAAEEDALAAALLLEEGRAHLHRHAPRDRRHRREERQAAVGLLDGLVGDAIDLALQHLVAELLRGREVKVGVDDLPLAHEAELVGERLLHLDDHLGALPDLVARGDHLRAGLLEFVVGDAGAEPRAHLDEHGVAAAREDADAGGDHADAVLASLDFRRNANDHAATIHARRPVVKPLGNATPSCPTASGNSTAHTDTPRYPPETTGAAELAPALLIQSVMKSNSILLLVPFAALASCGGGGQATEDEYNDVAQAIGTTTSTGNGGGEVGSFSDSATLATGQMPAGLSAAGSRHLPGPPPRLRPARPATLTP